jgi:predicted O-methyltransferase YrrM
MELREALAGIDHHLWSSEPDVAQFLACLVRMHHFTDVVEVGVFKGLTTSYIIDSLGSTGRYVGIDLEDHRCESVRAYMEATGHSFVLGDSIAQLKKLAGRSAHLIFLDGDHSLAYVKAEFLESLRILRPEGIICIHDYHSRGVRIWVDYVKRSSAFQTLVLNTSENRGLAVIVPAKGERSAGPLFRLWFALSRNEFALRVQGKLESMFPR